MKLSHYFKTTLRRVLTAGILFPIAVAMFGCSPDRENVVVLYTSQDRVYAEPIIQQFERETGIEVLEKFDTEATKTTGLITQLILEQDAPKCDVFWSNEELRTRQLVAENILNESGWTTTCYRTRRIVINTNLISIADAPKSFQEITNATWRGKFVMAYPQFGTTATHMIALRQVLGPGSWSKWIRAVEQNEPLVVDGNSTVVRLVGAGEVAIGFTDSDDIDAGQREGLPIVSLPVPENSLLIHNTVALVSGRPESEAVRKLYDYLRSEVVSQKLIDNNAAEGIEPPEGVRLLSENDWSEVLTNLDETVSELNSVFLR